MESFISLIVAIILVVLIIFLLPESCKSGIATGCTSCTSSVTDSDTDNDGNGTNDNGGDNSGTGDNGGDNGGTGDNGGNNKPSEGTGDSGVNITTGKVEVDIVNLNFESVVGSKLKFAGETEYNPILFQPGDVYYTEGFKIKNNGNIKMTYKMFVTAPNDVDKLKFADAFDFYITTNPNDLSNAIKMLEFNGTLDPGKASTTFYIVVIMKREAGNEFQNVSFNGLGITVNASQILSSDY